MLCGRVGGMLLYGGLECETDNSVLFARALADAHLGIQRAFRIPAGVGWVLAVSPEGVAPVAPSNLTMLLHTAVTPHVCLSLSPSGDGAMTYLVSRV